MKHPGPPNTMTCDREPMLTGEGTKTLTPGCDINAPERMDNTYDGQRGNGRPGS